MSLRVWYWWRYLNLKSVPNGIFKIQNIRAKGLQSNSMQLCFMFLFSLFLIVHFNSLYSFCSHFFNTSVIIHCQLNLSERYFCQIWIIHLTFVYCRILAIDWDSFAKCMPRSLYNHFTAILSYLQAIFE